MIKDQISTLLESEMDRKSFIKAAAIAGIALTGVAAMFKTISSQFPATTSSKSLSRIDSSAYGVARYGKPQLS